MNKSFVISLKEYWNNLLLSEWNLFFPLLMVVVFVFFSIIISLIKSAGKDSKKDENKKLTTTFTVISSFYLSGITTLFLFLCWVIYKLKFTTFFASHFCQFGVIIGFFIIFLFTIFSYISLSRKVGKREASVVDMPISNNFLSNRIKNLKAVLRIMLLFSFVLMLPFLILLVKSKQQHLVSIVLDNSGSMMEMLPYGISALEAAIQETPGNAQYIFTTLTQVREFNPQVETLNQYYDSIIKVNKPSHLPTKTEIYSSEIELINAFYQVDDAGGSPLYQGIWQNYLMSRQVAQQNEFNTKKLIVISDGIDNIYQYKMEFPSLVWISKNLFIEKVKGGQTIEELFDGGIYCINLGESDYEFMYKDCMSSIQVFDGTNQQSYFNALVNILPELYFDRILLFIISGLLIILLISLVITKTSIK